MKCNLKATAGSAEPAFIHETRHKTLHKPHKKQAV